MIERSGTGFVVRGPVTIATVNAMLERSTALFGESTPWELDFSAVEEVDSAAVSLLLEWLREAKRRGRELRVVNLPDNLRCLLKVYDLQEMLQAA